MHIVPRTGSVSHLCHLFFSQGDLSLNSTAASFEIETRLEQYLEVMVMVDFDQKQWVFLSVHVNTNERRGGASSKPRRRSLALPRKSTPKPHRVRIPACLPGRVAPHPQSNHR